jgi:hypothetical protein
MTPEEIACFKREMRDEIVAQVKDSFEEIRTEGRINSSLTKWVLATVLILVGLFATSSIYTLVNMKNYVTQQEYDKKEENLRMEINKNFSLPLQLLKAQNQQVQAFLIDKNIEKYKLAKLEEEKINNEIFKLNCELKRGGK